MFWKYVNGKLKSKFGTCPQQIDNDIAITDESKAYTLNTFFVTVFILKNLDNVPKVELISKSNGVTLPAEAVKGQLKNIIPNEVFGPDGIPARVLKELHSELAMPLCILFNKSIEQAYVPKDQREALVTAIFKKAQGMIQEIITQYC